MSGDFISWYNLMDDGYKIALGKCVEENVDYLLKNTPKLPDYSTDLHLNRFLQLVRCLVFEGAIQFGVKNGISRVMFCSLCKHFDVSINELVEQTEPVDLFFLFGQPKQALDNPVDREKVVYDVFQTACAKEFVDQGEQMCCLTIGFVIVVKEFLNCIHPEMPTELVLSGIASPFAIDHDIDNGIELDRAIKAEIQDEGYAAASAAPAQLTQQPVEMVVVRENQRDQHAHYQMPRYVEQQHQPQHPTGAGASPYRHQQQNRSLIGLAQQHVVGLPNAVNGFPGLSQAGAGRTTPPTSLHLHHMQQPIPMNFGRQNIVRQQVVRHNNERFPQRIDEVFLGARAAGIPQPRNVPQPEMRMAPPPGLANIPNPNPWYVMYPWNP